MLFVAQTFCLARNQSPAGKLSVLAMGYCFFSLFAAFHTSSWSPQQQYRVRAAGEEFPTLSLFSPHSDRTYFTCAGQHRAPTCATPGTRWDSDPSRNHPLTDMWFSLLPSFGFPMQLPVALLHACNSIWSHRNPALGCMETHLLASAPFSACRPATNRGLSAPVPHGLQHSSARGERCRAVKEKEKVMGFLVRSGFSDLKLRFCKSINRNSYFIFYISSALQSIEPLITNPSQGKEYSFSISVFSQ